MFKKTLDRNAGDGAFVPGSEVRRAANRRPQQTHGIWLATVLMLSICSTGCRTIRPLPAMDLTEPGWTTRQGQVVWRAKKDAPEIAGDLMVATNPDGRSIVQFTKTPLPFIVAECTSNSWQIQIVPNNKTYSGRGTPPARLVWLHLPRCLRGAPPPKSWTWQRLEDDRWRLENRGSGEFLEGYLTQ